MNIHNIISLPFIGFGIFTFVAEISGYELTFHNFRVSVRKGENVWDLVNIQIIFLSAVLYAGSLASTSGITFFEGYSWLRPGNAVAPFLGYFFGIPGCVGVAVGELIADSFSGYYSWGSIGGFLGNFALAYVPYKVLRDPPLRHLKEISSFIFFGAIGSTLLCAYIIVGLLDIIYMSGFMSPIPIIGGGAPPIEQLSKEMTWGGLFELIILNNIPMSLVGGGLILAAFGYLSEKGLLWRDRLGLFESVRNRRRLWFSLALGVVISYAIYNLFTVLDIYGKIFRSMDYLDNLIGILAFTLGILGFLIVSVNAVKRRILSIIMGSRSVDARALEVYFAARREVAKEGPPDEDIGERLATLLFQRFSIQDSQDSCIG
jgi:energy-coupling factor transport system substrate-specific component